jgi:hypothetical protein
MTDKPTHRQLAATAVAGMTAIGAWQLAGRPWLSSALGVAVAAMILLLLAGGFGDSDYPTALRESLGRAPAALVLAVTALWLVLVLGWLGSESASAFPGQDLFPVGGIVLLLLARYAVGRGGTILARCGAVCFLVLATLYTVVLAFTVPDLHPTWLMPSTVTGNDVAVCAAYGLLPAAALLIGGTGDRNRTGPALWGMAFLLLVPVLVTASLGTALTAVLDAPFYTMIQNVSILGLMERFEGVVCAAEQVGAFCMMGLLLLATKRVTEKLWPESSSKAAMNILTGAAIMAMWVENEAATKIVTLGSPVFCGILPLLTLSVGILKKFRKK